MESPNQSGIDYSRDSSYISSYSRTEGVNGNQKISGTGAPLVFVFGQNSYGELGLGDVQERSIPSQVRFFDEMNVTQIAAGNEHIAVLTRNGDVLTVGFNGSGQLGHGNNKSISTPKKIESLKNIRITHISSANGCENLAIISQDGKLYTCGYNNYGQLGHGTQSNLSTPTLVQALKDTQVTNVSCSYYHSLIVTQDMRQASNQQTTVYSVGRNDNGQLGQEHTCHEITPKIIRSLNTRQVIQTACGLHHSVFVTVHGEVFSCGFNDNGQLGHNDTKSRNQPVLIESLKNKFIVQAACGYYHTLVRRDTGEIYAFGRNDKGQLGIETNGQALIQPKQIQEFLTVSNIQHSGGNQNQLHSGQEHNQPSSQSLGESGAIMQGLAESNNLNNQQPQVQYLSKKVNISKIACGCYHSIALCESGQLFTFGRGNHGQLGQGNTEDQKLPKQVASLHDKKVIGIAGGFYHTIVLVKQKKVKGISQLSTDMKKIINEPSRADVTFIVESRPLHAHRCILFARCRSIEEKIRQSCRRSEERDKMRWGINHPNHVIMDIPEVKFKAFLGLIEYLYTDNMKCLKSEQNEDNFEMEHLLDLLLLSNEFKIEKLRKLCQDSIEPSINLDNCTIILKKANEIGHQADDLKKIAINFILQNYQSVMKMDSFYDLPNFLIKEVNMEAASYGVKVLLNNKNE
eukprot:403347403